MKKIAAVIASILLSSTLVSAQGISFGVRSGFGNLTDIENIGSGSIAQTWDKEVFIRHETKGRLAFEVGAVHYNTSNSFEPIIWDCIWGQTDIQTHEDAGATLKSDIVDILLSVQYDISCPFMKEHCPVFRNIGSYIGVNLGAQYASTEYTHYYKQLSDGIITEEKQQNTGIGNPQIGLSHTFTYSFNKLYLNSVTSYNFQPWQAGMMYLDGSYYPDSKLSVRIGLGYRL